MLSKQALILQNPDLTFAEAKKVAEAMPPYRPTAIEEIFKAQDEEYKDMVYSEELGIFTAKTSE